MSNYKRQYKKETTKNKILGNPDFLFGLTNKDSYNTIEQKQKSRLTGDKSNSLIKNKNKIIHSNSTSHIRADNYNIININVNNLIINNNEKRIYNNINNNSININNSYNNLNHSRVFSKAGNVIIGKIRNKNHNLSMNKNTKFQKSKFLNNIEMNNNNNIKSFNLRNNLKNQDKNKIIIKEKYVKDPTSDIKYVIKDLINNNKENENKENQMMISDENIINLHIKLWEEFFNIEIYADNKNGINNHLKKVLNIMEKDFIIKDRIHIIFINAQLNRVYSKIIKIYFVLITYFKFLLIDFNYELTIKSNIKRLLSSVSNYLLLLLVSYITKDNLILYLYFVQVQIKI